MTRKEFRTFQKVGLPPPCCVKIDIDFNPILSDTDPSGVMSVKDFVIASATGQPVRQQAQVSVTYNGLRADQVTDMDSMRFDGFDAAIAARREKQKINKVVKQINKDYDEKQKN